MTEGSKTEPNYFNMFNTLCPGVRIEIVGKRNRSSLTQLLNAMKNHLKNPLGDSDEAWIVADLDHNKEKDLCMLYQWKRESDRHGVAISNPMFEYWILLHFEDGNRIGSSSVCSDRLKLHIPGFEKSTDVMPHIGRTKDDVIAKIGDAIERAERHDSSQCETWPRTTGTTVCKLVKRILEDRLPSDAHR